MLDGTIYNSYYDYLVEYKNSSFRFDVNTILQGSDSLRFFDTTGYIYSYGHTYCNGELKH
jgi:hypothetical protein